MPKRIYANEAHQAQLQTSLASGGTETTVDLDTVEGWPVPGTGEIAIGAIDYGDQSSVELFSYTGVDTINDDLTGVTRGLDGTSKPAHDVGSRVRHTGSADDLISAQIDGDSVGLTPGRTFDSTFTPNADRPVLVMYTVRITVDATDDDTGDIELRVGTASPPTDVWEAFRNRIAGTTSGVPQVAVPLVAIIPPGFNVQLATVTVSGDPVFNLDHQVEVTL